MKIRSIFILLLLICCSFIAANELEDDNNWVEADASVNANFTEPNRTDHSTGFKWAWEMPLYADSYENLRRAPWLEAANIVEASGSFEHRREQDDQDNYVILGYLSFRPLVYDAGSYSFAFGFSMINRYLEISDFDPKVVVANINIAGTDFEAIITNKQVKTEAFQFALNFSTLFSVPDAGFQIVWDIGYGFSNLRETIDPITANIVANVDDLIIDEYQYQQRDEGLFTGINFLKSFDRDYLNFVRLFVYGAYRLKTTKRSSNGIVTDNLLGGGNLGKLNLEKDVVLGGVGVNLDPQQVDESNFGFAAYQLFVRLFTIYTPFVENRGISLSFFQQSVYTSTEVLQEDFHGFQMHYGGEISFFDAITTRITYVNEVGDKNERENGWSIVTGVQLSGIIRAFAK